MKSLDDSELLAVLGGQISPSVTLGGRKNNVGQRRQARDFLEAVTKLQHELRDLARPQPNDQLQKAMMALMMEMFKKR